MTVPVLVPESPGPCGWPRSTDTGREAQRDTDTGREAHRDIVRETHRQRGTLRHRDTGREAHRDPSTQIYPHRCGQTDTGTRTHGHTPVTLESLQVC